MVDDCSISESLTKGNSGKDFLECHFEGMIELLFFGGFGWFAYGVHAGGLLGIGVNPERQLYLGFGFKNKHGSRYVKIAILL